MAIMKYIYWASFGIVLVASTFFLWIRLVNYTRVLRCYFSKCRRFSLALIPSFIIGGLFVTSYYLLEGKDLGIFLTDLYNCIIIIAFLLHIEIMSFWSLLLYTLGFLILEIAINYITVPTGFDHRKLISLHDAIYFLDFETTVPTMPAIRFDTFNSQFQRTLNHQGLNHRNPFFLIISHLHSTASLCQTPVHFRIDQWSIYVPSVAALYLCRYNEKKSFKPSKLYVALTFAIMMIGNLLDSCLEVRLLGKSCGLVFSVPIILSFSLIAAAARKEFRFFVLSKNENNSIEIPSGSKLISREEEWTPRAIRPIDISSTFSPRSFYYCNLDITRKNSALRENRHKIIRKAKKLKRTRSVPKFMKYKSGKPKTQIEISLEDIRNEDHTLPFSLPELTTFSMSRWLDLTYLTYY